MLASLLRPTRGAASRFHVAGHSKHADDVRQRAAAGAVPLQRGGASRRSQLALHARRGTEPREPDAQLIYWLRSLGAAVSRWSRGGHVRERGANAFVLLLGDLARGKSPVEHVAGRSVARF